MGAVLPSPHERWAAEGMDAQHHAAELCDLKQLGPRAAASGAKKALCDEEGVTRCQRRLTTRSMLASKAALAAAAPPAEAISDAIWATSPSCLQQAAHWG